ncbi:NucA/NucB deoxyribonuclease domain-containing protein [Streptoalloteichus tenebrarius]|uniref:NucA/NucB deoxyribonuclease domain-containing protein n=1 Tax=Streptoalloteichus tenebrarius (strain ATCC 17920 / DSM 40477 / JCM 4838 / CBS 697.72 / NBRC 16177 / NCIMB 11028 / NRRL B-12390 / A12253. 1 / ISP 5477) TaxID=1933 RepID=UPI0020A57272|nr:NucA/NucB deoxyribonuclease domain-containing protein [Streptoalloteichus tenebrarius]BFF00905.1 hypothetical protein GCM10020241_25800 [Streptoalloteichus tenebrarius]
MLGASVFVAALSTGTASASAGETNWDAVPQGEFSFGGQPSTDHQGRLVLPQPKKRNGSREEAKDEAIRLGNLSYRDGREETQQEQERLRAVEAADSGPPQGLLDQCLNRPEAHTAEGRVLNRYFWCQKWKGTAAIINPGTGRPEGTFTLEYTAASFARPEDRAWHVWFRGDKASWDGSFTMFSEARLRVVCSTLTVGCSVDRGWETRSLWRWDDTSWMRWNLRSDENAATQQPEKMLRNLWVFNGQAADSLGHVTAPSESYAHGVRCDSATYFRTAKACVFTDVIPHLNYIRGVGYDEVVDHIDTALNNPSQTYPFKGTPKKIPGKFTGNRADPGLQRVEHNGPIYKANERETTKACTRQPPYNVGNQLPSYNTSTRDCDEYPFKSTMQGSSQANGNFSVKDVESGQNRRAGGILTGYYDWDRILHGNLDEFYVALRP